MNKVESVTLPAGEYWVGDPCYAVQDYALWDEMGKVSDWFQKSVIAQVGDKWVVGIGTTWGDGTYQDQSGREYPVDAGMIGVAPVADWVGEPSGMHKVTFDREFTVGKDDTTIVIGPIRIETDEDDGNVCDDCGAPIYEGDVLCEDCDE